MMTHPLLTRLADGLGKDGSLRVFTTIRPKKWFPRFSTLPFEN